MLCYEAVATVLLCFSYQGLLFTVELGNRFRSAWVHFYSPDYPHPNPYRYCLVLNQGWEFAHRFSERIALFLPKNEQMSDSLKKRVIHSFAHFWCSTWAICSPSLISSEQPERIAHGRSFWWATWAIVSHRSFLVSNLSNSLTSLTKKKGMSESLIFLNKKRI